MCDSTRNSTGNTITRVSLRISSGVSTRLPSGFSPVSFFLWITQRFSLGILFGVPSITSTEGRQEILSGILQGISKWTILSRFYPAISFERPSEMPPEISSRISARIVP